ncbi:polyribonucleotide nucleotidyltransferase [Clostridium sp. 'deep sea']|uniref:polyribonucleotide nucleotidyltransferase n=1 Tax=Clostridium sp. 'deep sea' TaxID=2779445 RepID=UPI00189696B4|nr:polyribonucleotide nucleotidyltransferase [Clostridium sp. 'deep sea']QOR36013.1 polyribonucleotide nucleotidyltransferase [Clostridium sp. 'deep sea']
MRKEFVTNLSGRRLCVEIGEVAKQANGAALVRFDDTVVLITATSSNEPREGIDFFPLTVDLEERLYAIGKIPGGWLRREGRPSEQSILNSRIIDRSIRPLFPKDYRNDVQIVGTILSVDQDNTPEVVTLIGTSIALGISDIPFKEIVGAVIIGRVNGDYIINPTIAQDEASDLHVFVAATKDSVLMVETNAEEVSEEDIVTAIKIAHEQIVEIIEFQEKIINEIGTIKKEFIAPTIDEALVARVNELATDKLDTALRNVDKLTRQNAVDAVKTEIKEALAEEFPEMEKTISKLLGKLNKKLIRSMIINEGRRVDGRTITEIRPLSTRISMLPRTHGSGLFTRGQTQVLSVTTLGTVGDSQKLDDIGAVEKKRYMHHYNFPPYSTGEARPMRGPKRREIGHGALAEKAIVPVLPTEEEFPYSIRVVSEVLESNGSSSMASVCGSSLSLMDAGVPIKRPVAGIALGLVQEDDKHVILSDIQGLEDFNGDMDFKVAGTENGITAIQLDIKITGLSLDKFAEALERARLGRLHILGVMNKEISEPKSDLSKYAPRMFVTNIPVDKIKVLIGSGGKTINKIIDETGVQIDIQEDGTVYVSAESTEAGHSALELISQITKDVEVGEIYDGKVNRIEKYGAFIELLPGKDGLLHISEMDVKRVNKTEDIVSLGDIIQVKVINIDDSGKIKLSRKQLLLEQQKKESNE